MSRASFTRKEEGFRRLNPDSKGNDVRGSLLDFLFCTDNFKSDKGSGLELGAAASVGTKRDRQSKMVNDRQVDTTEDAHVVIGFATRPRRVIFVIVSPEHPITAAEENPLATSTAIAVTASTIFPHKRPVPEDVWAR
ncbi:hypothetical protein HDU86_005937 [Geranomyces michiganensis]|nr:hypothetical protein HDU86_005937 [Geranomyces michiganensis]